MSMSRMPAPISPSRDTAAWMFCAWACFALAFFALSIGIYHLPADVWVKGYMAMGVVFLTGSSFTLSKTNRDNHEADKLINRVESAKTEKLLTELDIRKVA